MSAAEAISLLRTLPPDELAAVGSWLNSMLATPPPSPSPAPADAPWLAITRKYLRPGMTHDMDDIRASVERDRLDPRTAL